MTTEIPDQEAPKKRRPLLLIGGIIAVLLLCCICSFTWLAWTYGDAVIQGLLQSINTNF